MTRAGQGNRRTSRPREGRWTSWLTALGLCISPAAAQEPAEPERTLPAWAVTSYLDEAALGGRILMQIEFESDGSVWIAASDGLYLYDGYDWRRYGRADGLPSDYVRCVTRDREGRLWVGTDAGAGRFDGELWDDSATRDRLAGPSVRRIVEGPDGELWFCCDRWPDGGVTAGLTRLADGAFTTWTKEQGLPSDYVSDVFFDSQGTCFALTREGLARLDGARFSRPLEDAGLDGSDGAGDYMWSMAESPTGALYASHEGGVFVREGTRWRHESVDGNLRPYLTRCADGTVLTSTWGATLEFADWSTGRPRLLGSTRSGYSSLVQFAAEAPDGSIWVLGIDMLLRWQRTGAEWQAFDELATPLLRDGDGGLWFRARDGQSLRRYHAGAWTTLPIASNDAVADPEGGVWLQASEQVWRWTAAGVEHLGLAELGLGEAEFLRLDRAGNPWIIGRAADGRPAAVTPDPSGWRTLHLADGRGGRILSARPDSSEGLWFTLRTGAGRSRVVHAGEGGVRELALPDEAQSNGVPLVMTTYDGTVWVYGFFGLFERGPSEVGWRRKEGLPGRHVFHVEELGDELWISTLGTTGGRAGLVRLADGELQQFDQAALHLAGRDGNERLLYATRDRLAIAERGSDMQPRTLRLPAGLPVTSAFLDGSDIWVGTSGGVLRYQPDGVAPETRVVSDAPSVFEGEAATVRIEAVERFHLRSEESAFLGSHRIDGGEWSAFAPIPRDGLSLGPLATGLHVLEVRAMDEGGDADPTPAVLELHVLPLSLQDRPWFLPALVAVTAAIAGLALVNIAARGRLRALADGLEGTVLARTREFEASEGKHRALFEQSRDAICLLDPGGRIGDANPAAAALFGRPRGEVRGNVLSDLTGFAAPQPGTVHSGRIRRPGDDPVDVSVTASELTLDDGTDAGLQVILRDVTEHLRLEERLRQTQKMEAIGRMAGGIAHDFNNLLTAILGFAELLVAEFSDAPRPRSAAEQILKEGRRAKNLVRQIQAFSKGRVERPPVIDLRAALAGLENLLQGLAGTAIDLAIRGEMESLVRMESAQFEQIVLNLAVNARDAMPDGGTLSIELAHATLDAAEAERVEAPAPGEYVCLSVSDTGVGIGPHVRGKMFEPFFTTKPHGEGTGLGLAIVYGIVQQAGGAIVVEGCEPRGTRVEIYFPCRSDAVRAASVHPVQRPRAPVGRSRILVVDDEPVVRKFIATTLLNAGYETDQAPTGELALEVLARGATAYDILITDLMMPGMGGRELAARASVASPGTRVLYVSGHVIFDDEEDAPEPLLSKPFEGATLLAAVADVSAENSAPFARGGTGP